MKFDLRSCCKILLLRHKTETTVECPETKNKVKITLKAFITTLKYFILFYRCLYYI